MLAHETKTGWGDVNQTRETLSPKRDQRRNDGTVPEDEGVYIPISGCIQPARFRPTTNVSEWHNRRDGELNYYLSHTAGNRARAYLHKISEDSLCIL